MIFGEVNRSLSVLDGAVLISFLLARDGYTTGTVPLSMDVVTTTTVFMHYRQLKIPTIFFIQ